MQTQAWLCGVVVGCGLAATFTQTRTCSEPPTHEEMIDPSVRQAADSSRTLLERSLDDEIERQKMRRRQFAERNGDAGIQPDLLDLEAKQAQEDRTARLRELRFVPAAEAEKIRDLASIRAAEVIKAEIGMTMDAFHKAASEADFDAYFGLMHDDGMFLGTDATERWTKQAFMDYARPFMVEQGKGWTYHPRDRHVSVRGDVAWFDELIDNDKYGTLRGQGVLVREGGAWKVAQYSYTFLVPNDKAPEVVELILAEDGAEDGAEDEAP